MEGFEEEEGLPLSSLRLPLSSLRLPLSSLRLPLSSLRLLVSPVQLACAALWRVIQRRDVLNYGLLEEFVSTVLEMVPDLISYRERVQLIMGLRARLILELLCLSDDLADLETIEPHLIRMRTCMTALGDEEPMAAIFDSVIRDGVVDEHLCDSVQMCDPEVEACERKFLQLIQTLLEDQDEKTYFFQRVFPEAFGPKYDWELQTLVWEFLSRLEQLLSTQTFEQTSSLLSSASSDLEECMHCVSRPQPLKTLLKYKRHQGHLVTNTKSSSVGDCILGSLSLCLSERGEMNTGTESMFAPEHFPNAPETFTEQHEAQQQDVKMTQRPVVILHRLEDINMPPLPASERSRLQARPSEMGSRALSPEPDRSLRLLKKISRERYKQAFPSAPERNNDITPRSGIKGGAPCTVHVCSHCPFFHTKHEKMLQHIERFHREHRGLVGKRENRHRASSLDKGSVSSPSVGHDEESPQSSNSSPQRLESANVRSPWASKAAKFSKFICPLCERGMYSKEGLKRHMHFHTGAYKCYRCLRRFSSRTDVKRHLRGKKGCKKVLDMDSDDWLETTSDSPHMSLTLTDERQKVEGTTDYGGENATEITQSSSCSETHRPQLHDTSLPEQDSNMETRHVPRRCRVSRKKRAEYVSVQCRGYGDRVYRPRVSFISLTEEECLQQLHVSRQVVAEVCRLVAPHVEGNRPGPCALPVAVKVTVALAFFATGSIQHTLGLSAGVGQTAISLAVHAVSASLVRHAKEFITFPTPDSQQTTKQDFYTQCGFPGVLGAIGCTHVHLRAPSDHSVAYLNRMGVTSVNIQVVCDAHSRVTHVLADSPGSAHNSFVLDNSVIPAAFQGDAPLDGWLLGDNSYPLKPWLITPYVAPTTPSQRAFNNLFDWARSAIERTFGMLRTRFRCLDGSGGALKYSPQKVGAFFVACCILHNMAVRHGCHVDVTEDAVRDLRRGEAELHEAIDGVEEAREALEVRDRLAAELFP